MVHVCLRGAPVQRVISAFVVTREVLVVECSHGRSQVAEGWGTSPSAPLSHLVVGKKIDKDYSNWMGIKKN